MADAMTDRESSIDDGQALSSDSAASTAASNFNKWEASSSKNSVDKMVDSPAPEKFQPAVVLTGTAKEAKSGPALGMLDIGVSDKAYLCRIALPGLRNNESSLQLDIRKEGKVEIRGVVTGPVLLKDSEDVYETKVQQMSPPGPFSICFNLPGPVDPRLASPTYKTDGILEIVIFKSKPTV